MFRRLLDDIQRFGYCTLPAVFSRVEAETLAVEIEHALTTAHGEGAIRSRPGTLYAARNVLELYPPAAHVARSPQLAGLLHAVLGSDYGLVRALYFDKPPERSWSLPWHQDLTIAVANNRLPSTLFTKPTFKAGVPHVEAPCEILEVMLTLRIHLDDVTDENGPLVVLPGSHRVGKTPPTSYENAQPILATAGDVLAMRPLLVHQSGESAVGTAAHRRVLHLEFAAERELPEGYEWDTFLS